MYTPLLPFPILPSFPAAQPIAVLSYALWWFGLLCMFIISFRNREKGSGLACAAFFILLMLPILSWLKG